MSKVDGILLVGLTAVLFNRILIASASVEEAMQKRIEMFKASKANIKKLRKPIRVDDATEVVKLLDFHFK